jgi:putative endonuclease
MEQSKNLLGLLPDLSSISLHGSVAQLVEQCPFKALAEGSNPSRPTSHMSKIGVYILQGMRYYVGSTNDLDRRLLEHAHGGTHTTLRIGEWKLKKFIPCPTLEEARSLELKIKKSKNIARWIDG